MHTDVLRSEKQDTGEVCAGVAGYPEEGDGGGMRLLVSLRLLMALFSTCRRSVEAPVLAHCRSVDSRSVLEGTCVLILCFVFAVIVYSVFNIVVTYCTYSIIGDLEVRWNDECRKVSGIEDKNTAPSLSEQLGHYRVTL